METYEEVEKSSSWLLLAARIEQWQPLLHLLLTHPCPLGAALHWLHSHCPPNHHPTCRKRQQSPVGELWKLVPELLAMEVAYIQQPPQLHHNDHHNAAHANMQPQSSAIDNCMWMQTLPSSMQANILSFLATEQSRFHSKDLEGLCRRLLSSKDLDFWVFKAAETLYRSVMGGRCDQDTEIFLAKEAEMADYYSLPSFLLNLKKEQQIYPFSWLPLSDMLSEATNFEEKKEDATEAEDRNLIGTPNVNIKTSFNPELQNKDHTMGSRSQNWGGKSDENLAHVPQIEKQESRQEADSDPAPKSDEEMQIPTPRAITPPKICKCDLMVSEMEKARSVLGNENFLKAEALRETLLHYHPEREETNIMEEMGLFRCSPDLTATFSVIRPWEMSDDVCFLLVQALLDESEGYVWSTNVLQSVLLPKLLSLEQTASRVFISAMLLAGRMHPRATVDALLLPTLTQKTEISSPQSSVVNRLIKECLSPESLSSFCRKLFDIDQEYCLQISWTESFLGVVHTILSKNLVLEQRVVDGLVVSLERAAPNCENSLKFSSVLLSIISKHGSQLKRHKSLLQAIAKTTNTFMTKSVLAKLETI